MIAIMLISEPAILLSRDAVGRAGERPAVDGMANADG
jgi:hypothetical protein